MCVCFSVSWPDYFVCSLLKVICGIEYVMLVYMKNDTYRVCLTSSYAVSGIQRSALVRCPRAHACVSVLSRTLHNTAVVPTSRSRLLDPGYVVLPSSLPCCRADTLPPLSSPPLPSPSAGTTAGDDDNFAAEMDGFGTASPPTTARDTADGERRRRQQQQHQRAGWRRGERRVSFRTGGHAGVGAAT